MNNFQIEKLDNNNYDSWKILIKSILVQNDQWNVTNGITKRSDANGANFDTVDQKALATITLSVKKSQLIHIKNCATSYECWKKLEKVHSRTGPSRKVTLFKNLVHARASDDSIPEHIENFTEIIEKLSELQIDIQDEVLSIIILCSLPSAFENFVIAIESRDTLPKFEDLKTKILEENLRRNNKTGADQKVENSDNNAFMIKHRNDSKPKGKFKVRCYNCNKIGHKSFQCKKDNKKPSESTSKEKRAFGAVANLCDNTISQNNEWLIDSGATNHMTPNKNILDDIKESTIKEINVANKQKLKVEGVGRATVNLQGKEVEIQEVLVVPNLAANLLSVSQIVNYGNSVIFNKNGCQILGKNQELIIKTDDKNGMYKIHNNMPSCNLALSEDAVKWHRRLGHINYADLHKMKNGVVDGLSFKDYKPENICEICYEGKQSRYPFKRSETKSRKMLELIHADVCGPMEVESFSKCKYFATFIDDYSRKTYVYIMKHKSEVLEKFKEFKQMSENQLDLKVKVIRTDNGMEYCNKEIENYCRKNGIIHQKSNVYTPQQNGIAERMNRSIVERARCMLFDAGLPKIYWAEAVNTAVYVINRSMSSVLQDNTPEGIWSKKRVNLSNLRIFGSECLVHVPKEKRKKWDPKTIKMIFVGYPENVKGYRCLDPRNSKITISRDVVFMEKECHKVTKNVSQIFNYDPIPEDVTPNMHSTNDDSEAENSTMSTDESYEDVSDLTYKPSLSEEFENREDENSYVSENTELSEEDSVNTPIAVRRDKRKINPPARLTYLAVVEEEPMNVQDAKLRNDWKNWKLAMNDELESLRENKTWELVNLPEGQKPVKTKWVFKLKRDCAGKINRYKARLVAKGFSQRQGIDYEETFAPVVRYASIRLLMALAVQYGLKIHQMDAVTAFLQGDIIEDIYVEQPEEFSDGSRKVCKLKKALYGLKQAGRVWNLKLEEGLKSFGLRKSQMDPCIYYEEEMKLIVAIYVDDLLILWKDEKTLTKLKNSLCEKFKMKDLGRATSCIGIQINQKQDIIELDQQNYIEDILKRFGMQDCKPLGNPSDINQKLSINMESDHEGTENIPYQQAVGCLLYLAQCTRPDIAFSVNNASRFNTNFTLAHWKAIKRIMRYLKSTIDYRLTFRKRANFDITGYSDADWASDVDDRRSCTGYVFKLSNSAITWASRRQQTVALSSTEAEYMAMSSAIQEAVWIKQLAGELDSNLRKPITLYCDNQSALRLAELDAYRPRTKHIDIRFHFVREMVLNHKVKIEFIASERNVADSLTKPVTKDKFNFCANEMGLILHQQKLNIQ